MGRIDNYKMVGVNYFDFDIDFKFELLPEFQRIFDRSKMKIGELLVDDNKITMTELDKYLLSQSRIEKSTGIKPRILDLVYGLNFDDKVDYLESNNIDLLLGEKLIKSGLLNDKQLFTILKKQKFLMNNGEKVLFGELILKETNYNQKVIHFLVKNGYLNYEEINVSEFSSY